MTEKRKTIWEQMAEKQTEWIGGTLTEADVHTGDAETVITGIKFRRDKKTGQCFFAVKGKDWSMECDIKHLAIDPETSADGWLGLHGPCGMSWRIKHPQGGTG